MRLNGSLGRILAVQNYVLPAGICLAFHADETQSSRNPDGWLVAFLHAHVDERAPEHRERELDQKSSGPRRVAFTSRLFAQIEAYLVLHEVRL